MRLSREVLERIETTVGALPAETGAMLGGRPEDDLVSACAFDRGADGSRVTYSPDVDGLNRLLAERWNPQGLRLMGFVHSHPARCEAPSGGDLHYARAILAAVPSLERLLLPIVQTMPDTGRFRIYGFAAVRAGRTVTIERVPIEEVPTTRRRGPARDPRPLRTTFAGPAAAALASAPDAEHLFRRVRDAYDLGRLARARAVVIGVGGAAQFTEDLARAGVSEFVLVDPDTVSATNLATQQTYLSDLGQTKVASVARRLCDVNPRVRVVAMPRSLADLDDEAVERLVRAPFEGHPEPVVSLLCGFSDQFRAQARVNRLALKLEVPSLCAQVYAQGRAAEITFTHPEVTPACHRCVLASRYRAYLQEGFVNGVGSEGTPIFATARLNALKGFVALALLHGGRDQEPGAGGLRWRQLLERIGDRNLIQIRMDPDVETSLGLSVFQRVFEHADQGRLLFDEAVWLPQEPRSRAHEGGPCPDCGGAGSLRGLRAHLPDTRWIVG